MHDKKVRLASICLYSMSAILVDGFVLWDPELIGEAGADLTHLLNSVKTYSFIL